jgi:disease resistance protein RPM1
MSWGRLAGDQVFDVLCKAPNLKTMVLQRHFYSGDELVARTKHNFPELIEMRVDCDKGSPRVFSFQEGSMAKLERLELNFSDHERSIKGIEHLKKLKEVLITGNIHNSAIHLALEQLKEESDRRSKDSDQFVVGVRYD